ncbi:hypothetical protein [Pseudanabaena sp. 'Roaring Creek']|uniref:hypothetical protein n=1 Tax=Pseudanabaena sp. 'Roaring Creek' TaxID=1681830 RepID=UPI0006D805DE|nr:hypothetical protein [Pseudanabaena sp. 'Roaring Creek']
MLLYRAEYRFDLRGANPVKLPIIFEQSPIIFEVRCDRRKSTWNAAGTISQTALVPAVGFVKLGNTFSVGFEKQELAIDPQRSWLIFTPVPWLVLPTYLSVYNRVVPVLI